MSRSFQLQGGSRGSVEIGARGPKTGFFQKGVKHVYPSKDRALMGRILPARDNSLSQSDDAWLTSFVPYRDMTADPADYDKDTGTQPFTDWFVTFQGHKFFGRDNDSFVSPLTLKGVEGADTNDPIFQCYMYVKRSDNAELKKYIERPKEVKEKASIPLPSYIVAMNMYSVDAKDNWENAIITMTTSGLTHLKGLLSEYTPRSQPDAYDPNFQDYLFGDITDPTTGLMVTGSMFTAENNSSVKFNGFRIGKSAKALEGIQTRAVDTDVLARRYNLSSDETLKILNYQQLLDIWVAEEAIPFEIIKAACGEYGDVGGAKYSTGNRDTIRESIESRDSTVGAGIVNTPFKPTPPSPPKAPDNSLAPSKRAHTEEKFWVAVGDSDPTLMNKSDLVGELSNGILPSVGVNIMDELQTKSWDTPASYGLLTPVGPREDNPVSNNKTPSSGGSLTEAEAEELKTLKDKVISNKDVATEDIIRMTELSAKAG